MGRGKLFLVGVIVLVLLGAGGAALFLLKRAEGYDPSFDAAVAAPAYGEQHPVVLFDEGHHNAHLSTTGYRPLAQLLRADGYAIRKSDGEITADVLHGVAVLVVALAQGANETNDVAAFSDAEASTISEWVLRGGSLLLITDHWPFGAAAASLGERFGVDMSRGLTEDPAQAETTLGPSHIVFSGQSLADHAILRGRRADERVLRVLSYTGQSLRGPHDGVSLLVLSSRATDAPPTAPEIRRDGGDVMVSMTYGEPVSAAGRAQAVAVEFGRGRVVVLGEAAMLRAYRGGDGEAIGMNRRGYDNRQFALNVMHWLSRLI